MLLKNSLPEIITDTLPGPKAQAIINRRKAVVPNAIHCGYPVVMKQAAGAMIEDVDGNRFLDWVGGVGVLNVGHTHPDLVEAVKEQADKFFHGMFNIVTHEGYISLTEKLADIAPIKEPVAKVMFANSGAEADENAVKIAKGATGRNGIIVFSGAFHGRTSLTMAMTAKKAYAVGMGPFPDGIYRAQFPYLYRKPASLSDDEYIALCVKSVEDIFENGAPAKDIAAIVIEPLQGEGGFIPAPISFVRSLRNICDKHGILLIADEVQSGFGRTGKFFASEYWKEAGCAPDIISTAKSIAGGIPLSAVIASKDIMDKVPAGTIGGTYGGNALACAAGLKVVDLLESGLVEQGNVMGKKMMAAFSDLGRRYDVIGDVRGLGPMIGIEFVKDTVSKEPNPSLVASLVTECANHGLIIESAGTYGNVIRFLCPLVATDEQLDAGLKIFEEAVQKCM